MGTRPPEAGGSGGCSDENSIRSQIGRALKRVEYLEGRIEEVKRDLELIYSIQRKLEECMRKAVRTC